MLPATERRLSICCNAPFIGFIAIELLSAVVTSDWYCIDRLSQLAIRAVGGNWTLDLFLTKEVLYHWATTANSVGSLWFIVWGCSGELQTTNDKLQTVLERKTRLELATYSLEGYRSTKWATSANGYSIKIYKSCWWDLNSRPLPYQGSALPLSYNSQ